MTKKFELIATATPTTRGFAFSSIPATYDDLRIIWSARSSGLGTVPNIDLFFNNDTTGGNYRAELGGIELANSIRYIASTFAWWYCNGGGTASNLMNIMTTFIPSYRSGAFKSAIYETHAGTINDSLLYINGFRWNSTSAITQIDIRMTDPTYTFASGSIFNLYGIKNS